MGFEQRSNPFEQFGAQLTTDLTNYLVETLVNPYGVALLLQGKEFSEAIRLTRYEGSSVVYHLPEPKKLLPHSYLGHLLLQHLLHKQL